MSLDLLVTALFTLTGAITLAAIAVTLLAASILRALKNLNDSLTKKAEHHDND